MASSPTLLQWNCRGLRANFPELQRLLLKHDTAAGCLQETKLPPNLDINIRGYSAYHCHSGGADGLSGGTSIFVKNTVPHRSVPLTSNLQAIAVRMSLEKSFTLCSIYLPPSVPVAYSDLTDLLEQLPSPVILVGDFNAHNPLWGSSRTDPRGKSIEKLLSESDLQLLNDDSPTYCHPATGTLSYLDLTLTDPSLSLDYSWSTLDSPHGSDHYPIVLSPVLPETTSHPKRWNFARANWPSFQAGCIEELTSENVSSLEDFTQILLNVAGRTIPKTSAVPRKDKPWFNNDCRRAIKAREAAFGELRKSPTPQNLAMYKRERAKARRTIREQKRLSWRNYISKINHKTPISKIWKSIKKIQGKNVPTPSKHLLKPDGTFAEAEEEMANVLGEAFANNSSRHHYSPRFQAYKEQSEAKPVDFSSDCSEEYNKPFSVDEILLCLTDLKETAAGPDEVHNKILKNLPKQTIEVLVNLFNGMWASGTFPESWRQATVIPIPKPGKDHTNPQNYRPIALTSCICKLFERMVAKRLSWHLEVNNLLSNFQCGFRGKRCTTDHLIRLETFIREAFINGQHLVAVFFDLEKAYDTTWKFGILKNLRDMGFRGKLPIFIKNFLANRQFQVKVGASMSDPYEQEQGVPQGSVLSPILFGIQINSITETLKNNVDCSLYVDDFVVCYRASSIPAIERQLQLQLNTLQRWADTNGFKFSPQKTVAVHFCKKRKHHRDPDLYIGPNQRIPVVEEAKFLGVIFDKKLSFIPHLKYLRKKCQKAINLIKTVSGTEWGADRKSLLLLYRSLIRSKLDYGSIVYGSARPSYLKMLDTIHHQGLRLSLGAFRTTPVESLYVAADEPSLSERRDKLSLQYAVNLKSHPDNPAFTHVFHPSFVEKFQSSPNTIPPFGLRVRQLLPETDLDLNTVEEDKFPEIPPWRLTRPRTILDLAALQKDKTPPEVYRERFEEIVENHPEFYLLFTDGSKDESSVGAASHSSSADKCCGVNAEASVFTAEAIALSMALDTVASSRRDRFLIFSDSLSLVQAISGGSLKNPIIIKILMKFNELQQMGKRITLCWIPSHIGIEGNEMADELAKIGLELEPSQDKIPASDSKPTINRFIREGWQSRWNNLAHNKLHRVQPYLGQWEGVSQTRRRDQVVLDRIRLGHSHLTHAFLLRGEEPPHCPTCDCQLTIKHILVECRKFHFERRLRLNSKPLEKVFTDISPQNILQFLRDINMYSKI